VGASPFPTKNRKKGIGENLLKQGKEKWGLGWEKQGVGGQGVLGKTLSITRWPQGSPKLLLSGVTTLEKKPPKKNERRSNVRGQSPEKKATGGWTFPTNVSLDVKSAI